MCRIDGIVGALLLAAGSALVLAGCSNRGDRIDQGLRRGHEHLLAADWDKAGVESRNALQIDPNHAKAHLLEARVAEGRREATLAFQSYVRAAGIDPLLVEAHVGLARLHLLAGDLAKAREAASRAAAANPSDVGVQTVQAALAAREGDTAAAAAQARSIIAAQPSPPVDASLLLAGLQLNAGRADEAMSTLESALVAHPRSLPLLQVAAQVAAAAASTPASSRRAASLFMRAVDVAPKDTRLWNAWADHHIRRTEFDDATRVLRAAVLAQRDDPSRVLRLADLLAQRQGVDAAAIELKRAIDERPRDMTLRFGLVDLYRSAQRAADAQRVLSEIVERADTTPAGLDARVQLAEHHLAAARRDEARTLVAEVLTVRPRHGGALVLRGRMHLREGDASAAIADLRAAARDQPARPELVGLLAQAHLIDGEPQLAQAVLADAVSTDPQNADLRLLLASLLVERGDRRAAHAEIDAALLHAPGAAPRLHAFRARIQLAAGELAAAEKSLVAFRDAAPAEPAAHLQLARLLNDRGKPEAALRALEVGCEALPRHALLWSTRLAQLVRLRRAADAQRAIEAFDPADALRQQLTGELALARGEVADARSAFERWALSEPGAPEAHLGLAKVLMAQGRIEPARDALQRGVAANPDSIALRLALADWWSQADRVDESIQVYEEILLRAPGDDTANNNLAYLLADAKGDRQSLLRALRLADRFTESNNPEHLDSLGWIHLRLGSAVKALPLLQRAHALRPQSPGIAAHLGQAMVATGDIERGRALIRRALGTGAQLANAVELRRIADGG